MKNIHNKKINFKKISDEVDFLVRLSVVINEARKLKGWTQQKLAKKVGTTQKIVSKVESGDINIGSDLLQRFARSLNQKLQFGETLLVKSVPEIKTGDLNEVGNNLAQIMTSICSDIYDDQGATTKNPSDYLKENSGINMI